MKAVLSDQLNAEITGFRGRSWLPGMVLDWWDQRSESVLLLTGGPGTGKSMVSAWLDGYGPAPKNPTRRAELRRLRSLVKGAHFCNAVDTWNNSPKGMADALARQLTANLKGFSEALSSQAGSVVSFNIDQEVERNSGSVTGVVVKNLDLGGLLDEPSFLVALLTPLVEFYKKRPSSPALLLLVDALDEAAEYGGAYKILNAILALANLDCPVRVIATVRDPDILPEDYRSAWRIDLIKDAPAAEDDVADYIRARLEKSKNPALQALLPDLILRAGGNFLYASLVVQDLLDDVGAGRQPTIEDVPDQLAGQYKRVLDRLTRGDLQVWRKELRPVLGLLAVTQDPHLRLKVIAKVTRRDSTPVLDTLQDCKSYLSGAFDDTKLEDSGPFALFHKSFADFLQDFKSNPKYFINPVDQHATLAYAYWPEETAEPGYQKWDEYGLRNMPTHLAGASAVEDDEKRHDLTGRLVDLVVNPSYQRDLAARVKDLSHLERSLEKALQAACADPDPGAMALVIRTAFQLTNFRERTRSSRQIFRHSARGDIAAARLNLALFPIDADWHAAAELLIAWMAAEAQPGATQAARNLHKEVTKTYSGKHPLQLLAKRAAAAWGGRQPVLSALPPPPPDELLEAAIYRIRSEKIQVGLLQSYLEEVAHSVRESEPVLEDPVTEEEVVRWRNARMDGTTLIAYAAAHPGKMNAYRAFVDYLDVVAANQYRPYRNLALWSLMEAVLLHPDPHWVRDALARVISAALNPGGAPFTEAFGNILLGLKSLLKYQPAVDMLEERRTQALNRISSLSEERGHNDVTGAHKRRLAALALAHNLVPEKQPEAAGLLELAVNIPRGYAGFLAPAWLNLAETALIMGKDPVWIRTRLDEALLTARHVQNPAFRARTILFVNTLLEKWWGLPTGEMQPVAAALEETVYAFIANPNEPRFMPFYRLGQSFNQPSSGPEARDLPYDLLYAPNLAGIAAFLGYAPQAVLQINHASGWELNTPLVTGLSEIFLPDPDFTPWLAVYLAARLAASGESRSKKQELIHLLVRPVISDRTALDTIVARLLYAARPDKLEILRACEIDIQR
jgi:hypothetical protein